MNTELFEEIKKSVVEIGIQTNLNIKEANDLKRHNKSLEEQNRVLNEMVLEAAYREHDFQKRIWKLEHEIAKTHGEIRIDTSSMKGSCARCGVDSTKLNEIVCSRAFVIHCHYEMKFKAFKNGMTVRQLKEVVSEWPETNDMGDDCEVWVCDKNNLSNQVIASGPLNMRQNENGKFCADILLKYEGGAE